MLRLFNLSFIATLFILQPLLAQESSLTFSYFTDMAECPSSLMSAEQFNSNRNILKNNQDINWKVYIPKQYNIEEPSGVIIYTSPGQSIVPPISWVKLAEENNFIWVYSERSGRRDTAALRILFAEITVAFLNKNFNIDPDRIYAAGEGRITSQVVLNNPNVIRGAIYSGQINLTDKSIPKIRKLSDNRIVFITGNADNSSDTMHTVYRQYANAGFSNSKLIFIKEDHYSTIKIRKLTQALMFIDQKGP